MLRFHVNLTVRDLDQSVAFYSALFDQSPIVRKADYAKWMLDDPRLNFAVSTRGQVAGIQHLGLQAESEAELEDLRARLEAAREAGGRVEHEGETTCCYAQSDKSWVVDGQGVEWEAFYTHGEATTYAAANAKGRTAACCAETCCSAEEGEKEDTDPTRESAADCGCAPDCCEQPAQTIEQSA